MARFPGRISSTALRALAHACALFAVLLAIAAPALAGSLTLAWDPVSSPLVAGYVIHYGPSPGNYTASIDVGKVTTSTVSGLTEGAIYHFAVAAYDGAHVEGALSSDVAGTTPYTVPVANFSASTVSGPAPLALNFINTSTGTITSHAWTFGDGTTSTVANPTKVYSIPGTFTVGLTVTGPGGSNNKIKPNYITITASTDTTPPSAPGTPTATATGSTAISLTWPAATDNVAVTGYRVERCTGANCTTFVQVAIPTGTSYSNSGLAAGTTYRYRVRASDAAGNLGPSSAIASATTSSGADTTPPSAPASLTATASSSSISLTWSAATDNVAVTGYRVERCTGASCTTFVQVAIPTGTSYSNSGLAAGTTYRYRVRASDAAGNLGPYSAIASATTSSGADTTPPSAPASLTAKAISGTIISLTWPAATDNVAVTGYKVERCLGASCTTFTQIATPTGTAYIDSGHAAGMTFRYRVRATDAAGNLGPYSAIASATTSSGADTTPPSAPASLTATAISSTTISLTWSAATDSFAVTGYRVERCTGASCTTFVQVAIPTGTSYSNSGLAAGTTYRYRVRASDAAGNLSGYSSVVTASTVVTGAAPITYVQNNYATPQTPQSSVTVVYKATQTAGNLNVIVVGWNDTSAVVSAVTDSKGNVYTRAVGPTTYPGKLSQSIYYAKNIAAAAANSNVVSVTFNKAAIYADVRVVEYAGIDRVNPVDAVAIGSGTGTASSTSAVATKKANALIFGASTVTSYHTGPGPGFTSRVITSPDGDIVEDRIVSVTGSYSAAAPMTTGNWVMQLVAFRGL